LASTTKKTNNKKKKEGASEEKRKLSFKQDERKKRCVSRDWGGQKKKTLNCAEKITGKSAFSMSAFKGSGRLEGKGGGSGKEIREKKTSRSKTRLGARVQKKVL